MVTQNVHFLEAHLSLPAKPPPIINEHPVGHQSQTLNQAHIQPDKKMLNREVGTRYDQLKELTPLFIVFKESVFWNKTYSFLVERCFRVIILLPHFDCVMNN